MRLAWNELLSLNSPSFFLVKSRTRDIDIFSNKFTSDLRIIAKLIRGKNCVTTQELFKEFASALQFPYYFGNNWDAFDECIQDLSWLGKNDGYIIFITDSDLLTEGIEILLDTLIDASNYWKQKNKVFKVVFQTVEKVNSKIKDFSQERMLDKFDSTL